MKNQQLNSWFETNHYAEAYVDYANEKNSQKVMLKKKKELFEPKPSDGDKWFVQNELAAVSNEQMQQSLIHHTDHVRRRFQDVE